MWEVDAVYNSGSACQNKACKAACSLILPYCKHQRVRQLHNYCGLTGCHKTAAMESLKRERGLFSPLSLICQLQFSLDAKLFSVGRFQPPKHRLCEPLEPEGQLKGDIFLGRSGFLTPPPCIHLLLFLCGRSGQKKKKERKPVLQSDKSQGQNDDRS